MITVAKSFEWDMGHRITNHDMLCVHPHGHRYMLTVEVSGDIVTEQDSPKQGMIIDFGDLKKIVKEHVTDVYDHSFMYWEEDPIMAAFAEQNPELRMRKVPFVPTVEQIVQHVASLLAKALQNTSDVRLETVTIYETPTSYATWSNRDD